MQRRAFLASASAAASSLVFPISRRQIGVSDVIRFRSTLDSLSDSDDLEGGNERLEKLALFRAEQALGMSRMSSASPQARAAIHTGAAEAMNYAAWFALESGRTARARRHLTDALAHAGMSGDPAITLFTWVRMSVLSYRLGKGDDAEAAGQRARATPFGRRDPLFFSLCHVRSALAASQMGEKQSALRSLGEAGECLAKAQPRKRPRWIQFYDAAEFNALAANVHLRLGRPQAAEYHFHRTLSLIRPELKRNRSHYTAKLAIAQLRQGEPELACATAERLVHGELPTSARFGEILGTLRGEFAATGSAQARAWLESTPSVAPRRNV